VYLIVFLPISSGFKYNLHVTHGKCLDGRMGSEQMQYLGVCFSISNGLFFWIVFVQRLHTWSSARAFNAAAQVHSCLAGMAGGSNLFDLLYSSISLP